MDKLFLGYKISCKCMTNNTITKLTDLDLINRFLFDEVMENRESYQTLVGILLENEIHLLTRSEK